MGNHLWQSTLFAGTAGLLALTLRKNQARARYWVWLAASVKFLIPFSLLVEIGKRLAWTSRLGGIEHGSVGGDGASKPAFHPSGKGNSGGGCAVAERLAFPSNGAGCRVGCGIRRGACNVVRALAAGCGR